VSGVSSRVGGRGHGFNGKSQAVGTGCQVFLGIYQDFVGFVLVLRTEIRREGFSHPARLVLLFSFLTTACAWAAFFRRSVAGSTWTLVLKSATGVFDGLGFVRRLASFSRPYGTAEAVPFHNSHRREFFRKLLRTEHPAFLRSL
jgi:hypothetical protein